MTKKTYSTMGYEVAFNVPSTVEEYDQNAKRANACLDDAIDNTVYRGSLATFRANLCEAVEKETGIKRKTRLVTLKSKNEDGTPKTSEVWDGTEVEYFNEVIASGLTKDSFAPLAQRIADGIAFDASERERAAAGPKRIGKVFLDAALKAQTEGKLETLADKLGKKLKRTVATTVEDVATAIKEFQEAQTAAMLA